MSYPQASYLRAWLAGVQVQYLDGTEWRDIEGPDAADKTPHFYRDGVYRLKPQPRRARMYLRDGWNVPTVVTTLLAADDIAKTCGRWISEWIDYDTAPNIDAYDES